MAKIKLRHALECLFEQGRDTMFITDNEGNIIHANPAFYELYQYSEKEIIHQNSTHLWQNSMRDEVYYNQFLDTLKEDDAWSGELHITSKSGEIIPVWTQVIRVDDHFSVSQVDLRERDKVTRKMEQFSRLQSVATLAGGVAHEFNNILGGIQGHLYLFKRQLLPNMKKEKERLERINSLLERASLLVQNLLAFSKQKPTLSHEVDLNGLLEETVVMYKKSADKKIEINLYLPDQDVIFQADSVVLKQHVFELMSNAESAILRQRKEQQDAVEVEKIDVQLRVSAEDCAEILVIDNGSGMQDATLKHCLEPFFTTQAVGEGTGLGLSSAVSYIQQLQGSLEVESVFGEYTKVRIELPLHESVHALADHGTILLIDDDEDLRQSLEEILSYNGYATLTASNGLEGLDLWHRHKDNIDAIVMDIVMPNMDGIEVASEIRKENLDIPICLTTGYTYQAVPPQLHVNLIRKPLNPDLLLEFLENSIS